MTNEFDTSTVVVTGVSLNGLGSAFCKAISQYGPRLLIITGRDIQRPRAVAQFFNAQYAGVEIATVQIDLSQSDSVKKAASEIKNLCTRVDILVNNAGVMCFPRHCLTDEDVEIHLQSTILDTFCSLNY
jgi:short-subunit dehydrogenase